VLVLIAHAFGGHEVGVDLGLEGVCEHPPGPLADDFVEVERELLLTLRLMVAYSLHRCILPADVGAPAFPFDGLKGRYTTPFRNSSIHNFRLDLYLLLVKRKLS
jgi:hypothetical protein